VVDKESVMLELTWPHC